VNQLKIKKYYFAYRHTPTIGDPDMKEAPGSLHGAIIVITRFTLSKLDINIARSFHHVGVTKCGGMSMSIYEKTTTPIFLNLQMVHHFIDCTDITTTDINVTIFLVLVMQLVQLLTSSLFAVAVAVNLRPTDRQSVGQSVLVSGAHLGPVTNFSSSLSSWSSSCGCQSTSSSGYRAFFWDPCPDLILLFFFRLTITLFFFLRRPL
jgi:hypothetical protein